MENNHVKLSQSLEDYLEMVHMLRLANGIARVKDIAAALSVKMPSVAKAILELKKLGLVTQEPYSGVELTEEGRKAAADVLNRHILLKGFLIRLGVSEAIADKDACSMEHILSAETLSIIEDFMKKGNEGVVAKKANALKAKKGK
ncbi:iron (metal) dependent repressor, DtxR family [Fibrobacter sp. UWB16]|jgi:DtxR family Mn-dependent transcriptional regulator|uniref:Transcriptional regulator MntR n=1 Tax=Fibrobacter succinogenes TaxID=833 RepID=A0A380S638_FIBSU|nr:MULTISPECIES: iron dependent repressor, metal binding and dimerization domain protein [Fibrobacter]OWV19336.1 DtxR family transcriptional regulator [Fibrobacter sp. UWB3]OWV23184.1 DtxR family transcriptional regulator [Fibrobacter sp. UWB2]PWJ35709.1 DtxR family iron (metal) dependent repressor [Fibrobacter succinogenes subsp. elongatus]SMG26795.1 iron (metal) dependent repressor, DtxR family [Fibrobacter sp. UWB13]SOD15774.1 iron (metal) dependent repressor, DtxR family [Fibrobacter sp. U